MQWVRNNNDDCGWYYARDTADREPYAGVQFLSDHWPLTVVYEF
jgi:hypothetical protein